MKRHPDSIHFFAFSLIGLLLLGAPVYAGDLEPPGPPAPTMKTLDEVYGPWGRTLDATNGDGSGCDSDRFKCIMGNEAVLDLETGLVWEKTAEQIDLDWAGARVQCRQSTAGGRRGWRLPVLEELLTLIDPAQPTGSPRLPPGHPFLFASSGPTDYQFWTRSTVEGLAANSWGVVLDGSNPSMVYGSPKTTALSGYWCVRAPIPSDVH